MFNLRCSLLSLMGLSVSGLTVSALTGLVTLAAATPVLAQELSCGGTSVRLFCDRRDELSVFCLASHAEFILDNGQTRIIRTPEYMNSGLVPVSAACTQGNDGDYIVVTLINGGNCEECEKYALFKTDGTELTKKGDNIGAVTKRLNVLYPTKGSEINIEYRARRKRKIEE